MQLLKLHGIFFKKCVAVTVFTILLILINEGKINAQNADTLVADTNYIDTVSMSKAQPVSTDDYADEEDYSDTSVKHIYDTSEYFFNWKEFDNSPYATKKFEPRHLVDEEVNNLKKQDDFWYITAIENEKIKENKPVKINLSPWIDTVIWWILIGVFVAAIIYFLTQNKIGIFSRQSKTADEDATAQDEEDIFQLSYTKLILKAEKDGEYRVAVRLMFLQILKLLSETNHIQYQPDYTNLHYLQQLHQTKYYSEFFNLMRSYEYIWYGKFDVPAERYKNIKNEFNALQNKIR